MYGKSFSGSSVWGRGGKFCTKRPAPGALASTARCGKSSDMPWDLVLEVSRYRDSRTSDPTSYKKRIKSKVDHSSSFLLV